MVRGLKLSPLVPSSSLNFGLYGQSHCVISTYIVGYCANLTVKIYRQGDSPNLSSYTIYCSFLNAVLLNHGEH